MATIRTYAKRAGAALGEVVELMLKHHVKRLPVVSEQGELIGIVSRSDVVRALMGAFPEQMAPATDEQINQAVSAEFKRQQWGGMDNIRVTVRGGVVELDGTILDERQRSALNVAAENARGVKQVPDHLAWVEPLSGLVMMPPNGDKRKQLSDDTTAV